MDLLGMDDPALINAITEDARKCYRSDQPSKPQQIEAVLNLARLRNTFVMAGTGFGKSRIPEMYAHLFAKTKNPVVLVLNPLDALGDNQVQEKLDQRFTAINLKQTNFTKTIADEILRAKYNFIYLSPEIFLNNEMFTDVYHNPKFQDHLVLTVVDEAHMIYSWGLVANRKARRSMAHRRHQDRAIFRPSYGDLGRALMATQNTPILLLSATCRPRAISAILKSLRITEHNMSFVRAELTRPEIRILRVPMECSLQSTKDLLKMFGPEKDIPNQKLAPTLIYSGNRNATLDVMKVVNEARGIVNGHKNPHSNLIRRYHACTGNMEKDDTIGEFERADFPMISCTMALGLGQNWKRVRRVITMGRGDPSCICQMMGRCGRDGKPGLAILFMEKKRKFGLNTPEAIAKADKEEDDVRMDSLAMTPVCLRIAFSMDNSYGYIPMNRDDPNYLREEIREVDQGFAACQCSNCAPEEAEMLLKNMRITTMDNFDAMLDHPEHYVDSNPPQPSKGTSKRGGGKTNASGPIPVLDQFVVTLVDSFNNFFRNAYNRKPTSFLPSRLFSSLEANVIAENLDSIKSPYDVDQLIGGETMDDEAEMLYNCVVDFRRGTLFRSYKDEQERHEQDIQNEITRIRGIPEATRLLKQNNQKGGVKRKRSTATEVAENKKRRAEEKIMGRSV
ncbi:hypothetical protein PSHT_04140 [Puccinia striiformis]|uniref:DNA 3'-5' helicase n=2 Tax=Puccinia striiformis TaxID=27350 RepID=A0A2S4VRN8_9BASI|nr:hypothetical protein PSTT_04704 [Puccinia striiformis]POW19967.1 hypothetical protein PSHT_04140 [Puccinia striiformis]